MTGYVYIARCAHPGCAAPGHTLTRYSVTGHPTSDTGGQLFCDQHKPPRARVPRAAPKTPLMALDEFERLSASQSARLEEAIVDDDDDLLETIRNCRAEVERGLVELRKSLGPWEPKREAKPSRRPLSLTGNHPDQADLADGAERGEDV